MSGKSEGQKPVNETAEAIRELASEMRKQSPADPNHLGLSEEKIKALTRVPTGAKFRRIKGCVSEETGATFTLHVVESKAHKNGRITRLEDYQHPKGVYEYQSSGGLIPDGMPICHGQAGQVPLNAEGKPALPLHAQFKHHLWEEYWQKDLRRYVGKELQAHFCTGDGFSTPWEQSSYFGHEAAAAE